MRRTTWVKERHVDESFVKRNASVCKDESGGGDTRIFCTSRGKGMPVSLSQTPTKGITWWTKNERGLINGIFSVCPLETFKNAVSQTLWPFLALLPLFSQAVYPLTTRESVSHPSREIPSVLQSRKEEKSVQDLLGQLLQESRNELNSRVNCAHRPASINKGSKSSNKSSKAGHKGTVQRKSRDKSPISLSFSPL